MFSINWTFCIFFIVFSRFLDFSYPKNGSYKETARKSNKGLPKVTKGTQGGKGGKGSGSGLSSGRSGGSSGGGGSAVGGSDGNRNAKGKVLSGRFSQQLENRPPAAAPKGKKPYVQAFQEMRKLQLTTKLCISKYQMAR